ncbi:MAG TPA: hypothetical protein EYG79_01430 [Rhodobacteraceae bacterium]|nr:hypothetical protein [Paracoccaceae bacterium]
MKIHQNFVALMAALGYALLVLLANIFLQSPAGLLRMGFAIALFLVSRDALATANIAKGTRSIANPARWNLAFYFALFFGTFMLLALWRGMDGLAGLLPAVVIGSSLFGLLLAFLPEGKAHPYAHHFQTEKPMLLGKAGLILYYIAPVLKLAAIWLLIKAYPATPAYFFFFIIVIGFAFPRYARVTNGNVLWANFPTLIGYLVLAALIWFNL